MGGLLGLLTLVHQRGIIESHYFLDHSYNFTKFGLNSFCFSFWFRQVQRSSYFSSGLIQSLPILNWITKHQAIHQILSSSFSFLKVHLCLLWIQSETLPFHQRTSFGHLCFEASNWWLNYYLMLQGFACYLSSQMRGYFGTLVHFSSSNYSGLNSTILIHPSSHQFFRWFYPWRMYDFQSSNSGERGFVWPRSFGLPKN